MKNDILASTRMDLHDSWVDRVREKLLLEKKEGILYWQVLIGDLKKPTNLNSAEFEGNLTKWITGNHIAATIVLQMLDRTLQTRARVLRDSNGNTDAHSLWKLIQSWVEDRKYVIERNVLAQLEQAKQLTSNPGSEMGVENFIHYFDELVRRYELYGGQLSQSRKAELFLWGLNEDRKSVV